jgi:hypothetical protein
MSALELSYIAGLVLLITLLVAVAMLYSAVGTLIRRSNAAHPFFGAAVGGPEVGSVVEVPRLTTIRGLDVEDATRLAFTSVTCSSCDRFKEALSRGSANDAAGFALICQGTFAQVEEWARRIPDWVAVVADADGSLSAHFNIRMTPLFVRLSPDSVCLATGPAESILDLELGSRRLSRSRASNYAGATSS